ncbi:arginase family protein [Labrenzia sp. PHM005]|uniref:arginase family protein n=1 Tax=Labrenzia sp. PHM005 TaxID=2590016 RepID=UPI00143DC1FC|nr:arginase family protein [Labrenzia sp. PHM005]
MSKLSSIKTLLAASTMYTGLTMIVLAEDPASPDLQSQPKVDGLPADLVPWRDPNNPNVIILDDDSKAFLTRRDRSEDLERTPGPINMQRYAEQWSKWAFPTYLGAPVALTPEDLKAGEVDVAIVGLPSDFNPSGGQGWAANQMRIIRTIDTANKGVDPHTHVNYMKELNIVDYGNAAQNPFQLGMSLGEHARVLTEILDSGAIAIAIGGDHGTEAAGHMAMVNHFGPKNYATVHFDAHQDVYDTSLGAFTHGGRARRWAWENGWIKGKDLHSVGMRSPYGDPKLVDWQREVGEQYHYMPEFERNGFEETWKKVLEEVKGKRLHISFDVDAIDPAHVPGVSNPDPGGFTALEAIRMVRELAIQNDVAMIEFDEYSPLYDDTHYNTAIVIDRMMRAFLAGVALRKKGITDPNYMDPVVLDHGVK